MTDTSDSATRRARRLLRFYPRVWRARYGEEFTQLLIDDISERPHSVTRTADVVRTGLLARLASTGLAGAHWNQSSRSARVWRPLVAP